MLILAVVKTVWLDWTTSSMVLCNFVLVTWSVDNKRSYTWLDIWCPVWIQSSPSNPMSGRQQLRQAIAGAPTVGQEPGDSAKPRRQTAATKNCSQHSMEEDDWHQRPKVFFDSRWSWYPPCVRPFCSHEADRGHVTCQVFCSYNWLSVW